MIPVFLLIPNFYERRVVRWGSNMMRANIGVEL